MAMVQCLNPAKCGVQSHIVGSEQERNCININPLAPKGIGKIPIMKLAAGTSSSVRDLSTEKPSIIDEEIRNTENSIIDANFEIDRADQNGYSAMSTSIPIGPHDYVVTKWQEHATEYERCFIVGHSSQTVAIITRRLDNTPRAGFAVGNIEAVSVPLFRALSARILELTGTRISGGATFRSHSIIDALIATLSPKTP